ncbi:MAG: methionine biosynthesis protein MetW [Kordiimonas sp.]|nr:methionine biosynthesis protein MetW [Kordiimonas sp.]|tara:strand:- start:1606 stop:2265 length:660 start_codon:yes stop_codon:yes gene_type:complete
MTGKRTTTAPFNADRPADIRIDLLLIANKIPAGSRVLDVGCGDGDLLHHLVHQRGVDGRGIELSQQGVNRCVTRGLSVIQGNADTDLAFYPDKCFDYVILSQTLQATHRPDKVLQELLRIGRRAIVSFPNFGHWRVRLNLLLAGKMPVTKRLDYPWYSTPNIHFCTVRDFVNLCADLNFVIEEGQGINSFGQPMPVSGNLWMANVFGTQGLFVIKRQDD